MELLTPDQYKEIYTLFAQLDTDEDGSISAQDMKIFLADFNETYSEEEIASFMADHSIEDVSFFSLFRFMSTKRILLKETLDFPQFINMLVFLLSEGTTGSGLEVSDEDLRAVFKALDVKKLGFLTGNDVRLACRYMNEFWTDMEALVSLHFSFLRKLNSTSQINEMIYHRKFDGRFYFEDFKALVVPNTGTRAAAEVEKARIAKQALRRVNKKGGASKFEHGRKAMNFEKDIVAGTKLVTSSRSGTTLPPKSAASSFEELRDKSRPVRQIETTPKYNALFSPGIWHMLFPQLVLAPNFVFFRQDHPGIAIADSAWHGDGC